MHLKCVAHVFAVVLNTFLKSSFLFFYMNKYDRNSHRYENEVNVSVFETQSIYKAIHEQTFLSVGPVRAVVH